MYCSVWPVYSIIYRVAASENSCANRLLEEHVKNIDNLAHFDYIYMLGSQ